MVKCTAMPPLDVRVREQSHPFSTLHGSANLLIMPTLDAAQLPLIYLNQAVAARPSVQFYWVQISLYIS